MSLALRNSFARPRSSRRRLPLCACRVHVHRLSGSRMHARIHSRRFENGKKNIDFRVLNAKIVQRRRRHGRSLKLRAKVLLRKLRSTWGVPYPSAFDACRRRGPSFSLVPSQSAVFPVSESGKIFVSLFVSFSIWLLCLSVPIRIFSWPTVLRCGPRNE